MFYWTLIDVYASQRIVVVVVIAFFEVFVIGLAVVRGGKADMNCYVGIMEWDPVDNLGE